MQKQNRKERGAPFTIVIICEGRNTETFYLRSLIEKIEKERILGNTRIDIFPKPLTEDEIAEEIDLSEYKTRRAKKRELNNELRTGYEVEDDYKAEPVRFVREAQLAMQAETYNEAWAVFDNDHRGNNIEVAYELAANPELGTVQIVYSSIAFEHWFLLHFERNTTAFQKSECREGKVILDCNSGTHANDCYGARCVVGYLRNKGYLEGRTKGKQFLYPYFEPNLDYAMFNASWLRFFMNKHTPACRPLSQKNPYTDVDVLVRRLLRKTPEYIWLDLGNSQTANGFSIESHEIDGNLTILLTGRVSKIFNEGDITLVNEEFQIVYEFPRKLVIAGVQTPFRVNMEEVPEAVYVKAVLDNIHVYISIL